MKSTYAKYAVEPCLNTQWISFQNCEDAKKKLIPLSHSRSDCTFINNLFWFLRKIYVGI